MTAMLLALVFSESALAAAEVQDFRLVGPAVAMSGNETETGAQSRRWTPGVKGWQRKASDCPAFFQREVEGFGIVRVGPRCADEEIPYAL